MANGEKYERAMAWLDYYADEFRNLGPGRVITDLIAEIESGEWPPEKS